MKNLFASAILAATFFAFTVTGVQAADKNHPVSRSNVSNNKTTNDPKDQDCDGRADAPDCVKANKDYATDPYVETTARDAASGQASGKRKAKTSEAEVNLPAISKGTAATTTAPSASSPEGNPTPDEHAINTKGTGTAGIAAEEPPTTTDHVINTKGTGAQAGRAPRDAASGQATGKRQHGVTTSPDGTEEDTTVQARPGSDPFKGTNVANALKKNKAKE
ncbi:MAG TPA: hypothetical protein DCQ83_08240 [Fibrobacteres bacterium]|jgi:hypothetical protein|nr:hypothetical protein [Fibrobacterota bacterium]